MKLLRRLYRRLAAMILTAARAAAREVDQARNESEDQWERRQW